MDENTALGLKVAGSDRMSSLLIVGESDVPRGSEREILLHPPARCQMAGGVDLSIYSLARET